MRRLFNQFVTVLIVFLSLSALKAQAKSDQASNLAKLKPAIVNLSIQGKAPYPQTPDAQKGDNGDSQDKDRPKHPKVPQQKSSKFHSLGSGVIIDADKGYIVTNAHVVKNAELITVTLSNGRRLKGKKIGTDQQSDVAIIQINADKHKLHAVQLADSDQLQVGDQAYAIGNPYGLSHSVTSGVISGLHRNDIPLKEYEDFIQTDAPINPGNSGGALVNDQGRVIGINTAIIGPNKANVGIGFAIPANMVKKVSDQIINYDDVKRGYLGVVNQNLTPELADHFNLPEIKGSLITQVLPGSPAEKAGLQPKDVVLGIDGKSVQQAADVHNKVGLNRPGTKVHLKVARPGNKVFDTEVELACRQNMKVPMPVHPLLKGVQLHNFDQIVPTIGRIRGAQALNIDESSQAWFDGLRPGDVILSANNKKIYNLSDLQKKVSNTSSQLFMKVQRQKHQLYLVINQP